MIKIKDNFKAVYKNKNLLILCSIVFFIILTPHIRIKGLPSFRMEQLVVILFTLYAYIKLMFGGKIKKQNLQFPIMYLCFSFFVILSIIMGEIKGINFIANDFFELYKIYIYLSIYLIFSYTVKTKEDRVIIIKFIIFCLIISVLISAQQYFNILNLNERYVPLIAPTQYKSLVNDYPYPRVIGMTSNPNEYAVMPGIGAILSWVMYLNMGKKINLINLIIFILGVIMTKSRSGFAFMAIGIITYTFFYFVEHNFRIRKKEIIIDIKNSRHMLLALMLTVIIGIIIFIYLPKELTWRLIAGLNLKKDNSFQLRLLNWKEHLHYFKMSPLFGVGPTKIIKYKYAVDNEWLLFIKRYGIIGTSYFVLTFILPFIKRKDKEFKLIYFSLIAASAVYMIVVNIYSSFQVMPLIIIFASLIQGNKEFYKEHVLA